MEREKFISPKIEKPKHSETQERLEKLFELKKQYQEQVKALIATGVIELLPETGKYGVYDINGKECPIPSYDEILKRMEAKAEMLTKKQEQGFGKLLLVPIGTPLSFLIDRTRDLIVKKYKEGKLLGTDGAKLELNEDQPVDVDKIFDDSDIKGDLVYYPQKYDQQNHGGRTKAELLADLLASPGLQSKGWEIELIEDLPDLPAKRKSKKIGDRRQLGAGLSPGQYLKMILNSQQYNNEQGITPEAYLIYFINYLQVKNQVIDDRENNKDLRCFGTGVYSKKQDFVPCIYWNRYYQRLSLLRMGDPYFQDKKLDTYRAAKDYGTRTTVKF
ncbi:MAG: hypothetical protein NTX82_02150 [Candidatus Parcubacteria bacterium]|nr:hypothetical protein [Candidatus Parcubacteria bacterium]